MTTEQIFEIVKKNNFFTKYAPGVKNFNHKYRGLDGNKKPIDFTADDKKAIEQGAKKLAKDLENIKID